MPPGEQVAMALTATIFRAAQVVAVGAVTRLAQAALEGMVVLLAAAQVAAAEARLPAALAELAVVAK